MGKRTAHLHAAPGATPAGRGKTHAAVTSATLCPTGCSFHLWNAPLADKTRHPGFLQDAVLVFAGVCHSGARTPADRDGSRGEKVGRQTGIFIDAQDAEFKLIALFVLANPLRRRVLVAGGAHLQTWWLRICTPHNTERGTHRCKVFAHADVAEIWMLGELHEKTITTHAAKKRRLFQIPAATERRLGRCVPEALRAVSRAEANAGLRRACGQGGSHVGDWRWPQCASAKEGRTAKNGVAGVCRRPCFLDQGLQLLLLLLLSCLGLVARSSSAPLTTAAPTSPASATTAMASAAASTTTTATCGGSQASKRGGAPHRPGAQARAPSAGCCGRWALAAFRSFVQGPQKGVFHFAGQNAPHLPALLPNPAQGPLVVSSAPPPAAASTAEAVGFAFLALPSWPLSLRARTKLAKT